MKLLDVPIGARFRYPDCGLTATLVGLGSAGARIKYENRARQVELEDGRTGETVAFEAPGKPILVSDASEVEVLP